jgi:hypothetical protein
LALLPACTKESGPAEGARTPEPPPAAAWEGIYQGPYHIYLRLVTNGTRASGSWQAMGERTGEFSGEITGDVLNFHWTERFRDDTWSGRGYFVYGPSRTPGKHEIRGQWGLGNRNTGGSWWAIKRSDLPLDTHPTALMDAGADESGDQKSGTPATAEPEAFED